MPSDIYDIKPGGTQMQPTMKHINANQQYQMNSTQHLMNAGTSTIQNTNISELVKGALIQGEIIDLRDTAIQLLLSNGQILKGSIDHMIPLSIGQQASFLIDDTTGSKIVLKLLTDPNVTTQDATVDKALEEAMLPKNEKNITIVNELLKNGMSIDKSSIQNLLRQSYRFKGVSIETLVIMNKYQIPVNDTNATQLEAYRNYEFRLLTQGNQLCSSLSDVIFSTKDSNVLLQDFLQMFQDMDYESPLLPPIALSEDSLPADTPHMPNFTDSEVLMPELSQEMNLKEVPIEPLPLQTHPTFESAPASNIMPQTSLPSESTDITKLEPMTADHISALIEKLLKKDFSLPLRNLGKEHSISQFYDKMEEHLGKIQSYLTEHAQQLTKEQSDSLSSQTAQMKNNLDFMKTLNQMFSYIQLPMKLPAQDVHSELFVYTNKKKLQSGENEVSVLLHLDMTHLGPLDFHLALKNHHVNAKICLSDDASLHLLQEYLPELVQALKLKGYEMTASFEQLEKETKIVRDYFEENSDSLLMKRYTFDKRA